MRKCLFEILAERGSTYWKEGVDQWVPLLFSCTDFTVVEASKVIVKVAMETGFPCISTI